MACYQPMAAAQSLAHTWANTIPFPSWSFSLAMTQKQGEFSQSVGVCMWLTWHRRTVEKQVDPSAFSHSLNSSGVSRMQAGLAQTDWQLFFTTLATKPSLKVQCFSVSQSIRAIRSSTFLVGSQMCTLTLPPALFSTTQPFSLSLLTLLWSRLLVWRRAEGWLVPWGSKRRCLWWRVFLVRTASSMAMMSIVFIVFYQLLLSDTLIITHSVQHKAHINNIIMKLQSETKSTRSKRTQSASSGKKRGVRMDLSVFQFKEDSLQNNDQFIQEAQVTLEQLTRMKLYDQAQKLQVQLDQMKHQQNKAKQKNLQQIQQQNLISMQIVNQQSIQDYKESYEQQMQEFREANEKYLQDLLIVNQQEIAQLYQECLCKLEPFKASPNLLAMQRTQQQLDKMKDYDQAQCVLKRAQALEKQEKNHHMQEQQKKIQNKINLLKTQQIKQINAINLKMENTLDLMVRNRDQKILKLEKKTRNVLQETNTKQNQIFNKYQSVQKNPGLNDERYLGISCKLKNSQLDRQGFVRSQLISYKQL